MKILQKICFVLVLTVFLSSCSTMTKVDSGDCFKDWDIDDCRVKAEQGYAEAQYNLGQMYSIGKKVPRDYKESLKWHKLAAEQGNDKSQHTLGVMYHKGQGVPQNFKESVKWYRKSSNQGNSKSHYLLGVMYHNGTGVPKDYVMTLMYWNLASVNLHNNRYNLERKMSSSQIDKAQELSIEWMRKHNNVSVIPIHKVVSNNRTLSNVDDKKSQSINRCSELFIKNLEKDKSWKLYKIDERGQCVLVQRDDNCSIAVATGVCVELTYDKSKNTKIISNDTMWVLGRTVFPVLNYFYWDRILRPFLKSLVK